MSNNSNDNNNNINYNNKIADDLFYVKGLNIFPLDNGKVTYERRSKYNENAIPNELFEEWKKNGRFAKGIVLMPGKVFRGENEGLYFVGIDLDKEPGIKEFCNIFGANSIDELKDRFMIEQHDKNPNSSHPDSLHVYFYSEIPFIDKSSDITGIEIKSNNKYLMCTTPSYHAESNSNWRIIGTDSPVILKSEEASKLMSDINEICKKYNVKYLNQYKNTNSYNGNGNGNGNGHYYHSSSHLSEELRQLAKSRELVIPNDLLRTIKNGTRHSTLVSFTDTLLFANIQMNGNGHHNDKLKTFLYEINDKVCEEPLLTNEIESIWKSCKEYTSKNTPTDDNDDKDDDDDNKKKSNKSKSKKENDDDDFNNYYASNSKASVFRQFKTKTKKELSEQTCWSITSLNPIKLLIAHSNNKHIVRGSVIKYNIEETSIEYLNLSTIVIHAIPKKIILNKDLLGLSDNNYKYTIEFVTESNNTFTLGPKTLDEIITNLRDRALINVSPPKAAEAFGMIIGEFESDKKLIVEEDIETPGFYFVDGEIRPYHIDLPAKPIVDQMKDCCELLDTLQAKFKKKDVLPTMLKWSIMAPFDYVLKQIHQKWMKWPYAFGWSNTGKSSLGEKICCCIHDRYNDDKKRKESIIPFTAADTVARLGVSLSRSTYPIVINEVSQLSDEYKNRALVEMIKATITNEIAREKYVNKINWTRFLALSACILTSNSAPPRDVGFKRRIIPIEFTQKDQYSADEMKELDTLFDQRIKHELKYLGNFATNYILENQQELIIKEYEDWKITAEIVLTKFYELAGRIEVPEWIKYFVEEKQLEDSKEDIDLLFRSFLMIKINETYNKFHGNIQNLKANTEDVPFDFRFEFCLNKNLIPFFNPIKTKAAGGGTNLIAITSDILNELKQKIPEISSLSEIASIINGFEYGPKRMGGRVLRIACGTKKQLLDFLEMNHENENEKK